MFTTLENHLIEPNQNPSDVPRLSPRLEVVEHLHLLPELEHLHLGAGELGLSLHEGLRGGQRDGSRSGAPGSVHLRSGQIDLNSTL